MHKLTVVAALLVALVLVALSAAPPDAGAKRTRPPRPKPTPAPAPTPTPTPQPEPPAHLWAVLGNNEGLTSADKRAAGVNSNLATLSWRKYFPQEGVRDQAYVERKRAEFQAMRDAGLELILSLGYHDTPTWLHTNYGDDSYYRNQWGEPYTGTDAFDNGDANLVFNPRLRSLVGSYMKTVMADFGTDFVAVRLGGGRYGELTYPPTRFGSRTNAYWAFDGNASAANPVPGWKPGSPSPNGEAKRFLDFYLQALTDYEVWQVRALRQAWSGPIMMLFPSWGIRPGQADGAAAGNLSGATSAESNGEIQRGYDFARQIAAIDDPGVIVTTTWLEANVDPLADGRTDQRYWTPVHYLAHLAANHPLKLKTYGENGGHDHRADMEYAFSQALEYGLMGLAWFREGELASGQYATLTDLGQVIASAGR